jgi:hydrogenase maturation protease
MRHPLVAPEKAVCETLVIGVGNPLRGDDGVGVRVAEVLAGKDLPRDVEVVDGGTQGLGIVSLMEGRRRVVLVDATDMGRAPGSFVRFTLEKVRLLGEAEHLSIHDAGLRDSLLLAQALGTLPEEVIIFGVQPARIEWEYGLSPEVEAELPALVEAILMEVSSHEPEAEHDSPGAGM